MRAAMIFGALLLALPAGCVSKAKYAELEQQYNRLERKLDTRNDQFVSVFQEMKKVADKDLARLNVEDGRVVLQLESDVLFNSGSAELSNDGLSNLKQIARILSAGNNAKFQVEGHTDSDGDSDSNWKLGAERSINVVETLIAGGLDPKRVSAASMGEYQPVSSNGTDAGKRQNRRIELVLQPELSDVLPYKSIVKELNRRSKGGKNKRR